MENFDTFLPYSKSCSVILMFDGLLSAPGNQESGIYFLKYLTICTICPQNRCL